MLKNDVFNDLEIENVIKVTLLRGHGNDNDPFRKVSMYYTTDGKLICEHDPMKKEVNFTSSESASSISLF